MLLFEAKNEIERRLEFCKEFDTGSKANAYHVEALEIAAASIDAQIRLADILNDWWASISESDSLSANAAYEIMNQIRFDHKEEDEA